MADYTLSLAPWYYCHNQVTSVEVELGVTHIGSYAFQDFNKLVRVFLARTVSSIGSYAFQSSPNLTSLTLPGSVTTIGSNVFSNCSQLRQFTVQSATPPTLGTNVFSNVHPEFCVRVPHNLYDTYAASSSWSSYLCPPLPTVMFDAHGDSSVSAQTVQLSGTATEPEPPTRYGHTLEGWYGALPSTFFGPTATPPSRTPSSCVLITSKSCAG